MRNSLNLSRVVLTAALIASLAAFACSSTQGPDEEPLNTAVGDLAGAPDWILRGCSAFWGDDSPAMICGVGSMAGTRNHSLAVSGARARGRTAIARTLDTKVTAMLKDYQSTTTGGEYFAKSANDEQHIEDVSKQITDITLSGTRQEDHWISDTGTLYVLMALDVDDFKDAVNSMSQLNEEVRQAVNERADEAFEELDRALR